MVSKTQKILTSLLVASLIGGLIYVMTRNTNSNSAEGFGLSNVASSAESAVSKVIGSLNPEKVGKELANQAYGFGNGNSNGNSSGMNINMNSGNSINGDLMNGNSMNMNKSFEPAVDESSKMNELVEMNKLGCSNMLLSDLNAMPAGSLEAASNSLNSNKEGFAPYGNNSNMNMNMNSGNGMVAGFSDVDGMGVNVEGTITDSRQFPQFPQDQLTANELLPKQESQMFADLYPAGQGSLSDRRDFLTSAHHIGINTVGQTLKNASWDLRSEIPNPQKVVSVWNQSTTGPDPYRKQFEIGMA